MSSQENRFRQSIFQQPTQHTVGECKHSAQFRGFSSISYTAVLHRQGQGTTFNNVLLHSACVSTPRRLVLHCQAVYSDVTGPTCFHFP